MTNPSPARRKNNSTPRSAAKIAVPACCDPALCCDPAAAQRSAKSSAGCCAPACCPPGCCAPNAKTAKA